MHLNGNTVKWMGQKTLRTAKKYIYMHTDIYMYVHKRYIKFSLNICLFNSLSICLLPFTNLNDICVCSQVQFTNIKMHSFPNVLLATITNNIYNSALCKKKLGILFLISCTFCARPYSKQLLQSDNVSLTVFCVLHIKLNLRQTLRKRNQKAKQYSMLLFLTHKRLSVILEVMTVFSSP